MALLAARTPVGVPLPLVGVSVAVSGNILIALALNVQKLAHTRLQQLQPRQQQPPPQVRPPIPPPSACSAPARSTLAPPPEYGTFSPSASACARAASPVPAGAAAAAPDTEHTPPPHVNGTSYLRSRLWWIGIGLMTLGETGNFISYGFAPASLIAPLGSAALLANVFLAPMVVGEELERTDVVGAALCALGAGGVVWSVPSQGTGLLSLEALVRALRERAFIVYCLVDVGVATALSLLSLTSIGASTLLVDVGVCACLGSLTVLATKSLSGLLAGGAEGGGGFGGIVAALDHPLLLALVAVLASSAVGQVVFLNRALQRFDASRVIPTHFTLFTISAILGSAVLFRDFATWPPSRVLCFLLACSTTFGGVYVLARHKNLSPDEGSPTPAGPVQCTSSVSTRAPEPETIDPLRPVLISQPPRPQLRSMATDTMLIPRQSGKDVLSTRPRRYLAGPTLALSTWHYLLLPLDGASFGPEPPALTQTVEAQSESGHRGQWSRLVPRSSLAFRSLSRSLDQRSWTEFFASPREVADIESSPTPAPGSPLALADQRGI